MFFRTLQIRWLYNWHIFAKQDKKLLKVRLLSVRHNMVGCLPRGYSAFFCCKQAYFGTYRDIRVDMTQRGTLRVTCVNRKLRKRPLDKRVLLVSHLYGIERIEASKSCQHNVSRTLPYKVLFCFRQHKRYSHDRALRYFAYRYLLIF